MLYTLVSAFRPFVEFQPVGWEGIGAPAMQEQRLGREGRAYKKGSLPAAGS